MKRFVAAIASATTCYFCRQQGKTTVVTATLTLLAGVCAPLVAHILTTPREDIFQGPSMTKHMTPVPNSKALASLKRLRQHATQAFGFDASGGPVAVLSVDLNLSIGGYCCLYEIMLQTDGPLERVTAEAIAHGVSQTNLCQFCANAHLAMQNAANKLTSSSERPWATAFGEHCTLGNIEALKKLISQHSISSSDLAHGYCVVFQFNFINRVVDNFVLGPDEAFSGSFQPILGKLMKKMVEFRALSALKQKLPAGVANQEFPLIVTCSDEENALAFDLIKGLKLKCSGSNSVMIESVLRLVTAATLGGLSAFNFTNDSKMSLNILLALVKFTRNNWPQAQEGRKINAGGISPVSWAKRESEKIVSIVASSSSVVEKSKTAIQNLLQLAILTIFRNDVIRGGADSLVTSREVTAVGQERAVQAVCFAAVVAACRVFEVL